MRRHTPGNNYSLDITSGHWLTQITRPPTQEVCEHWQAHAYHKGTSDRAVHEHEVSPKRCQLDKSFVCCTTETHPRQQVQELPKYTHIYQVTPTTANPINTHLGILLSLLVLSLIQVNLPDVPEEAKQESEGKQTITLVDYLQREKWTEEVLHMQLKHTKNKGKQETRKQWGFCYLDSLVIL